MENIAQLGIKVDSSSIKTATTELNKLTTQSNKTESSTKALASGFSVLKNAVIAYAGASTALKAINIADSMNLLNARLKLTTDSTAEYISQQKELLAISKDSYTGLSDTITLFTKLNPALKQLGADTEQVNEVVSSFTKGLQLGGSTAAEASSAILQFSQSMGSGILRGEEFNAIAEASPKLMSYLAKGLGVAQTELRKMAENGELTAGRVSNALLKVSSTIDRDFATLPITVGKAMANLQTDLGRAVSEIDTATGATSALSGIITTFSGDITSYAASIVSFYKEASSFVKEHNEALETTGIIIKSVGIAYVAFAVTSGIATGISTITASVVALRASILLLQTSIPILGWISAAVGVAAGSYVLAQDMLNDSNAASSISNEKLIAQIKELEARKEGLAQNKYKDSNTQAINDQIDALKSLLKVQTEVEVSKVKNINDIIPQEQSAIDKLIGTEEKYQKKISEITLTPKRNDTEIIKLAGTEQEKFNLKLDENIKKMKELGATEKEINAFRLAETKDFNEKQAKALKSGTDEAKKQAEETQRAYQEISQIGLTDYDKSVSDIIEKTKAWTKAGVDSNTVLQAELDLKKELNLQKNLEGLQEELSYYEKKLQLQKDSIEKELELKAIQYSSNVLSIEGSNRSIEEKEKLIAKETELYDLTVERLTLDANVEFQDTLKSFQEDALSRQIELNNAIFDFGEGFSNSNTEIMEVSKSLAAMNDASLKSKKAEAQLNKKYEEQFTKYAGDVEKTKILEQEYTKENKLLNEQNVNNQIVGYANIAGAISGMFEDGSKEAEAFSRIQAGIAMISGVNAVLAAAALPPPMGFASMATMAASVTSLLASIGVAFSGIGGSSTTSTSDAFSSQAASDGSGSTLGDATKASESITKSMETLEDFAKPEFLLSQQMAASLESIDSKLSGVSALLLQEGGFSFGEGYEGFNTGFSNNLSIDSGIIGTILSPINSIISSIPVIGQINDLFGGVINSVLGGLFGKTSVSQSLADSGITFADAYLSNAIETLDGAAYQTISTTTKKKSWFSSSSKTSVSSYFEALDSETERQFSLVLSSLYDTVVVAGAALDVNAASLENSLNNFVVSIGKISLKDLTGDEIQETLTAIFGKIGDDIAKSTFPTLTAFQAVGEGMFETLVRVANGMEQANYYVDRLGATFEKVNFESIINKQGEVGFEALYQSIMKIETGANFTSILSVLSGTAEELYDSYIALDLIRDRLEYLGKGVDGLTTASITGAGGLEALSDGINAYIENFYTDAEQQQVAINELNQEFGRAGITAIPTSIAGFKELVNSIDTTNEAGQTLYGRLIVLSESFSDVYSEIESAAEEAAAAAEEANDALISNRVSLISTLSSFVSSLSTDIADPSISFKTFSTSFNNMIDAIARGADDLSDIGALAVSDAQGYIDTVTANATSSADIEFAKKVISNKFEGVINASDITLGTINDTLRISFNEDSVIVKALYEMKNELVYLNSLNSTQTANSIKTLNLQRASIA